MLRGFKFQECPLVQSMRTSTKGLTCYVDADFAGNWTPDQSPSGTEGDQALNPSEASMSQPRVP